MKINCYTLLLKDTYIFYLGGWVTLFALSTSVGALVWLYVVVWFSLFGFAFV